MCEMCDFWRYNVDFLVRVYSEQPHSPTGIWNRLEYRPLEGFVLAVSPFNFTCIGGNLSSTPGSHGLHGRSGSRRRRLRSPPTTTCDSCRRPACRTA